VGETAISFISSCQNPTHHIPNYVHSMGLVMCESMWEVLCPVLVQSLWGVLFNFVLKFVTSLVSNFGSKFCDNFIRSFVSILVQSFASNLVTTLCQLVRSLRSQIGSCKLLATLVAWSSFCLVLSWSRWEGSIFKNLQGDFQGTCSEARCSRPSGRY
jgi:hypothetical protein